MAQRDRCFAVELGGAGTEPIMSVEVKLPVLSGQPSENLFGNAAPAPGLGEFTCLHCGDYQVGFASVRVAGGLEHAARRLYGQLFEASRGHTLCRIWNYVPGINAAAPGGLENYQAFSKGRAEAFEQAFGPACTAHMPAASAVGTLDDLLVVVFAATRGRAIHVENPLQIPAFDYPPEHGPRAPSFARATVVERKDGVVDVFASGTSSIRGHVTVAPSDTPAQLTCTLENLAALSRACGLGDDLGCGRAASRFVKVYLRHGEDLDPVARVLSSRFLNTADQVTYLQADICRADLNIEIEVSAFGVAR